MKARLSAVCMLTLCPQDESAEKMRKSVQQAMLGKRSLQSEEATVVSKQQLVAGGSSMFALPFGDDEDESDSGGEGDAA